MVAENLEEIMYCSDFGSIRAVLEVFSITRVLCGILNWSLR